MHFGDLDLTPPTRHSQNSANDGWGGSDTRVYKKLESSVGGQEKNVYKIYK